MTEILTEKVEREKLGQADLRRELKGRHVQMIAIGGTIGVGLFLGSAVAIRQAGPGLALSYALGGMAMFVIMRALGELLLYRPVSGSFASYAEEFIGPWSGFATGWSYWFMWVVTGMAQITAVGVYVHYWLPNAPQWIPALVTLGALFCVNVFTVRLFGEIEFWFALVKVLTLVATIVVGFSLALFNTVASGQTAGLANLWSHGGFFPAGALGVLLPLQMVMFAYQGLELVGVSAGETEDPEKVLPRAINSVLLSMVTLYVGALLAIMSLLPWSQLSPSASPFVVAFERIGVPAAAQIVNLVVITAAASACSSGLYSNGRMLYSLAKAGQAPRVFERLSRQGVPVAGVAASAAAMLIGVALNYVVPERVFVYVTSVSLIGSLWTWGVILVAHLAYRRAAARGDVPRAPHSLPGAPYTNALALAFLLLVAALLSVEKDTRVALYVAPAWFALLALGYRRATAISSATRGGGRSRP
jgi:AAT family amino acid transporter/D-serine/D-alanine/glycine transporter